MQARDDLVAYLRVDLISFLNENIDFVACLVFIQDSNIVRMSLILKSRNKRQGR